MIQALCLIIIAIYLEMTNVTGKNIYTHIAACLYSFLGESNIQNHSVEDDLDVDGLFKFGSYNLNKAAKQLNTATMYKMTSTPRGIAVIISNKNFLESSGQHFSSREGTEVDREALKRLFKILQFKVEIYNNQTKAGIRRVAVEMAAFDHSKYDAFIFAVLSHGREGVVYGTDGIISIRDITSSFTQCRSLAGKPKIFFFQACQGRQYILSFFFFKV